MQKPPLSLSGVGRTVQTLLIFTAAVGALVYGNSGAGVAAKARSGTEVGAGDSWVKYLPDAYVTLPLLATGHLLQEAGEDFGDRPFEQKGATMLGTLGLAAGVSSAAEQVAARKRSKQLDPLRAPYRNAAQVGRFSVVGGVTESPKGPVVQVEYTGTKPVHEVTVTIAPTGRVSYDVADGLSVTDPTSFTPRESKELGLQLVPEIRDQAAPAGTPRAGATSSSQGDGGVHTRVTEIRWTVAIDGFEGDQQVVHANPGQSYERITLGNLDITPLRGPTTTRSL